MKDRAKGFRNSPYGVERTGGNSLGVNSLAVPQHLRAIRGSRNPLILNNLSECEWEKNSRQKRTTQ